MRNLFPKPSPEDIEEKIKGASSQVSKRDQIAKERREDEKVFIHTARSKEKEKKK